jgi:hypothetical protein
MHGTNEALMMHSCEFAQSTPEVYKLWTPYNNKTRIYEFISLAKALENINDPFRSHLNKELFWMKVMNKLRSL